MIPIPAWLDRLDQDLFRWLNVALHEGLRDVAGTVLAFANQTGSGMVGLPLVAAAFVLRRRGYVKVALQVALALALVGLVNGRVKQAFARPRPQTTLAAEFLAGDLHAAFGEHQHRFSLPSGHAATYAALATLLVVWSRGLPRANRRFAVFALVVGGILVSLARIYAGSHYPLDAVGGGAVGVACGLVALGTLGTAERALARRRGASRPDLAANAGWTP